MAVVGGAIAYLLCDFGGWPMLMYEPYEHEWLVARMPPTAAAMVYPGMILWGFCGALSSSALTLVVASRVSRPASDSLLRLVGGWALTSVLVTALYFLWGLWPF
jgi:hypothetical protein